MESTDKNISLSADFLQVMFVSVAMAAAWLLFAAEFSLPEIIAAIIAGIAAGLGGYALRKQARHKQSGLRLWLRHFPGIIARALADCWKLTVMLAKILAGKSTQSSFRRIPFNYGPGNPDDIGRRVLATIGTTLQPNSYVAGYNETLNEVLVHELVPTPGLPIAEEITGEG